jgi:hypothetical protein
LGQREISVAGKFPQEFCCGAPVHFTRYTLAERREYDVTRENFKMPDWQRHPGHGQ